MVRSTPSEAGEAFPDGIVVIVVHLCIVVAYSSCDDRKRRSSVASNLQKRKAQKKANRKKRLSKERNMRANRARFRYRLDVKWEGEWKVAKRFRTGTEVQKHLDETEAIRKRGDTEIIEGRVIDLNSWNEKVVATVKPFLPEVGPSLKEAAKDIEAAIERPEGCLGPVGDQGAKQEALKINRENFEQGLGNG